MLPLLYKNLLRGALLLTAGSLQSISMPAVAGTRTADALKFINRPKVADVTVSGRVTGANGDGLPGVTVFVKGTSMGSTTNSDGMFSLKVPEGSTLVFSFIGYISE